MAKLDRHTIGVSNGSATARKHFTVNRNNNQSQSRQPWGRQAKISSSGFSTKSGQGCEADCEADRNIPIIRLVVGLIKK